LCIFCQSQSVVKNGKRSTGEQNYKCKRCNKQFTLALSEQDKEIASMATQSNNVWIRWFGPLEVVYV
jgi:transposase-like protein